jgi:predicted nucleic acid-binding protein
MIFVDTSAWYAITVPTDPRHAVILSWYRSNSLPIVTTDYVVDETLTLLRARGEFDRAVVFGRQVFDLVSVPLRYLDRSELRRAWEIFRDQPLRRWSFTDCTSKAVIEQMHIKQVLTFDHHFQEFGGLTIMPNGRP